MCKTEPANASTTSQAANLQAFKSTFWVKITGRKPWLGCGGCSFVCRSVRITGLLSTPWF